MPKVPDFDHRVIFEKATGHPLPKPKPYIAFDLSKKVIAGNIGKV